MKTYAVPTGAVLILASSFTPQPVLITGLLLASLVAAAVIARCFEPASAAAASVGAAADRK